jgi:hypothetical protein
MSDIAISLRPPTGSNNSLKIIFNKTASEEYSLSDGREGQFPKIVERDSHSIAQDFGPTPLKRQVSGYQTRAGRVWTDL